VVHARRGLKVIAPATPADAKGSARRVRGRKPVLYARGQRASTAPRRGRARGLLHAGDRQGAHRARRTDATVVTYGVGFRACGKPRGGCRRRGLVGRGRGPRELCSLGTSRPWLRR
jgi:pyruvate/2-oxoglutarate/acetoin dehydrogenase E1 component